MTEQDTTQDNAVAETSTTDTQVDTTSVAEEGKAVSGGGAKRPAGNVRRGGKRPSRQRRGGRDRGQRQKPEYDQKIISIRRVTRVMAGGRRFAFSVALVAGNRNGKVGVGTGKAADTALAIEKAFRSAKKNMVTIPRTKSNSIAHEVEAKYCTAEVFMQPAPGKGVVAGSSLRTVLDLAGITDVSAKILSRSKNQLNNARAAIKALRTLPNA